jgi:hypothetical protein
MQYNKKREQKLLIGNEEIKPYLFSEARIVYGEKKNKQQQQQILEQNNGITRFQNVKSLCESISKEEI